MAIQYVGSQVGNRGGELTTQNNNYALTGGLGEPSPAAGDLVVIALVTATDDRTPACDIVAPATWAHLGLLTVGTQPFDTCLDVSYKFMPASPNTSFQTPASGNSGDSQSWTVHVYRGVDPVTPLDVAAVSASGTGTTRGNPPAITPVTPGAFVFVTAGGASGTASGLTQAGGLSGFRQTAYTADPNDSVLGAGHVPDWLSGTVDIGPYTSGSNVANDSWASYAIALRPAVSAAAGGILILGP